MTVTASRREIGLRKSVNLASRRLCHGEQRIGITAKGAFVAAKNQQNVPVPSGSKIGVSLCAHELYTAPPDKFSAEQWLGCGALGGENCSHTMPLVLATNLTSA